MEMIDISPQLIVGALGAFISLFFKYFPVVRTKYAQLKTEYKSLIMIGLLILTVGVACLLMHFGVIATAQPVTLWTILSLFFYALSSNQFSYLIFPEPEDVTEAKSYRNDNESYNNRATHGLG